ncbi:TatD family hydrolase [Motiliproteus sp. MSK22-1]|uniref:TatD family hydrolase n=1 Tax=Motiliproteus sp. MSK22-1 TaxID=1897630 RepID=UPI000978CE23|nr:TatD family hydrolase [Motiliproteus sp. MSK22-1]OMH32663.1 hydrolase TatD [Motiliproteus sp. MSK22-1]
MLIDSHCHLDRLKLDAYDGDLNLSLKAAREQGVGKILCVSTDMARLPQMLELVQSKKDVLASVGVHPISDEIATITEQQLLDAINNDRVVAIGETGLDYYYQPETIEQQKRSFEIHLRVAGQSGLPVIVHTRNAKEDTLALIRQSGDVETGGVLHCFTEDWEMARQAIDLNYWISFSGIITFRNAAPLREVVKQVPLERILVETDAPYLTPAPYRGQSNEPKFVKQVAERVAEIKGLAYEEVVEATTSNFFRLFNRA